MDQLHVAAMVLSWVLAIGFVVLMLRPFLRRNKGETTRIAKMLAQLPAEVDIEGLVFRLLLASPAINRCEQKRARVHCRTTRVRVGRPTCALCLCSGGSPSSWLSPYDLRAAAVGGRPRCRGPRTAPYMRCPPPAACPRRISPPRHGCSDLDALHPDIFHLN